jgi:hypothetical protein
MDGSTHFEQGCQIFLGTWYQNRKKCTKWTQNVPNGHKISQMSVNIPNGHKYINIFQSRALQNLPKLGFWVWKKHLANLISKRECTSIIWLAKRCINDKKETKSCTEKKIGRSPARPDAEVKKIRQRLVHSCVSWNVGRNFPVKFSTVIFHSGRKNFIWFWAVKIPVKKRCYFLIFISP